MKVQYLATVRPPRASCEARFLREGRSIAFLEAHLRDAHGNLAAVATSTWRISPGPG
jgi:acyl-coenzyme A thioesterase PaaI-like protein